MPGLAGFSSNLLFNKLGDHIGNINIQSSWKDRLKEIADQEVTEASQPLGCQDENYLAFRQVGAVPELAVKRISINRDDIMSKYMERVQEEYGLDKLVHLNWVYKGKVLDLNKRFSDYDINPNKDRISIVADQEGAVPPNYLTKRNEVLTQTPQRSMDQWLSQGSGVQHAVMPVKIDNWRLIKEDLETRAKKSTVQRFLQKIYRLAVYGDEYVFGMIYKWTNNIKGHPNYGKVYIGRTEQHEKTRTIFGHRAFALSKRFHQELKWAIVGNKDDLQDLGNEMYIDIREYYESCRRAGDDHEAALAKVYEAFTLDIEDILFCSDSYSTDCNIMEKLEEVYMQKYPNNLYNDPRASGASGKHVSYQNSGHSLRRRIQHLKENIIMYGDDFIKAFDKTFTNTETKLNYRLSKAQILRILEHWLVFNQDERKEALKRKIEDIIKSDGAISVANLATALEISEGDALRLVDELIESLGGAVYELPANVKVEITQFPSRLVVEFGPTRIEATIRNLKLLISKYYRNGRIVVP